MNSWLEKDFTLKVISILVGIVLWFQVTTEQNPITPRTFQNVPVKFVNLESGMFVMETVPTNIRITVQSQKRLISGVTDDQVTATVDLKGAEPGRSQFPVKVALPAGIDLVEVVPENISISLDVEVTRSFKPEIKLTGSPNEDFVTGGVELKTPEVALKGPKSKMQSVQKVVGEVDVAGAAADVTRAIDLRAVDGDGREVKLVTVNPKQIEIRVAMKPLPPAKMVKVVPQIVGTARAGFRVADVTTVPKEVRVRGPADKLGALNSIRTYGVDVSGQSYDVDKQAELVLPPGFSVEQRTVLVRVAIVEDRIQRTFQAIPVRIQNVSPGQFRFNVNPPSVDVTIEGRRDQVEALNADDIAQKIQPFINAAGLGAGSHELRVQVPVSDEFSLEKVTPENVTLTLTPR
ncbi:MAG: hypothetical protein HPY55_03070 [Firmicutes bacterium]|nr:hypothetical protein [Bacillota bacterium]